MLNERAGCLKGLPEVPSHREPLRQSPGERRGAARCGPSMKSFSRERTNGLLVGKDAECNGLWGFRLAAGPIPVWRFPRFSSSCARRVNSAKVNRRNGRNRGRLCGLLPKGGRGSRARHVLFRSLNIEPGPMRRLCHESADPAERTSHSGAVHVRNCRRGFEMRAAVCRRGLLKYARLVPA